MYELRNNRRFIQAYQLFTLTLAISAIISRERTLEIISYQSYVVIKVFVAFNVLLRSDKLSNVITLVTNVFENFVWKPKKKISSDLMSIEGLPLVDVLTYCFDMGGLPAKETMDHFNINQNQYKRLGDRLELLGVLVRGEKNARVVNTDFDQDTIIDRVIEMMDDGNDVFVKTHNNSYNKLSTTPLGGVA